MKKPLAIFIVYAHEDRLYKDELIKALSPLKNQGWVESWHDGDIRPGEVWDSRIRESLESADLILPLVSNDFFDSEYIQEVEIRAAFARYEIGKCIIVPVIIRACEWQADIRLARLKALPTGAVPVSSWSNRDEAYQSIAAGVRKLAHSEHEVEKPIPPANFPETNKANSWKRYLLPALVLCSGLLVWAALHFGKPAQPNPQTGNPPSQSKTDSIAYRAALEAETIPALQAFLHDHPSSSYSGPAQQKTDELQVLLNFNVAAANALYKGGKMEKAYEAFEKALKINPDDPEVKRLFILLEKWKK